MFGKLTEDELRNLFAALRLAGEGMCGAIRMGRAAQDSSIDAGRECYALAQDVHTELWSR